MKRLICAMLCILLAAGFCACGGNTDDVKTHDVDSEIYSQKDIDSAINTIKKEFGRSWKGCTLTEIFYAGDESSRKYQAWADKTEADEAIVLLFSFDVDSTGGNGSLNPNSTYSSWSWILVRDRGGKWRLVDHGY